MVANGCFLDEAFGEIKTQDIKNKRKKKKKETGPIVFDRSFIGSLLFIFIIVNKNIKS